jgi:large subunit ribosomal protein L25
MSIASLNVMPRERAGKGSARAARRAGLVPAVIYGNKETPIMVTVVMKDLVKQINKGHFLNTVFELEGEGIKARALPRALQLDPVRDWPIHVDFLRVAEHSKITMMLPVHFSGQEASPGLKRGGVLNVVRHEIECLVPTDNIPEQLEIDVTGMDVNESIHISMLKLPEGVEPVIERDFTIATIGIPSAMRSETAEDATAEGAEAAKE